jgi:hypothetical protein
MIRDLLAAGGVLGGREGSSQQQGEIGSNTNETACLDVTTALLRPSTC